MGLVLGHRRNASDNPSRTIDNFIFGVKSTLNFSPIYTIRLAGFGEMMFSISIRKLKDLKTALKSRLKENQDYNLPSHGDSQSSGTAWYNENTVVHS